MKAALLKNWNDLVLTDVEKPIIGKGEALIKVRYGGVCGSDITVYKGQHSTAIVPVVLCHEILGTIDELPADYSGQFCIGDRVLIDPVIFCGACAACKSGFENVCANLKLLGIHVNGGFAEYTKAGISKLIKADPKIPDEIAILGEPFAVAYHVNSRAGVRKNDKVLVIGAGTVGIVVALIAREFGAGRVVMSEINPGRLALAKSLGLETINPAETGILKKTKEMTEDAGFDVVFDASGSKASAMILPDLCRIHGTIVSLGLSGLPYEFVLGKISFKEISLVGSRLYSHEHFKAGVEKMVSLTSKYDLSKIVTDIMPLDKAIEAVEMMKSGRNLGKIIIKCNES